MNKSLRIAVVGALGAVGQEMLEILGTSSLPISKIKALDTATNVGKKVFCRGAKWLVEEARPGSFTDVDIALFSAGGAASAELAPIAVAEGAIVVDNSSHWRMTEGVPLVIPEVNPQALLKHKGLIANPNCSTIQMALVLKPLHDRFTITRVVVSTYQAVSGSGVAAIRELRTQSNAILAGKAVEAEVYPHQIAFNAIAQIDVFEDNGYTKEELKLVNETNKILESSIKISPTAVRIPVFRGHSESLNIEFSQSYAIEEVVSILSQGPGIKVLDDPTLSQYPTPVDCTGKDLVYVGRIRRDISLKRGLNLWIVSDNLRKGAALNTVQIAEKLVELNLLNRR